MMVLKVGEWTSSSGLNISNAGAFHDFGQSNITLQVTTIATIPYVMLKAGNHTGNDRYEGFCIDLLEAIADMLNFKYELYFVPDGKFGAENTTSGEWNGLVREIIDKVSCVCDETLGNAKRLLLPQLRLRALHSSSLLHFRCFLLPSFTLD